MCLFVLRVYHDEKDAVFDYTCDNNLTTIFEIRLVGRHQPRHFSQVMREKGPERSGGLSPLSWRIEVLSSEDETNQCQGEISMTTSTNEKNTDGKGGYAKVHGLDMYYEIHGTGKPLVLIPGGLMTIGMMGQILPFLASTRQVIAVELQGHGHTADIDRTLTYEQMADDIAALIRHLGLDRADVFGFSAGGGVALQTAIRHPEVVRKLVVASAPSRSDGEYPEIRALMASFTGETSVLSPNREAYVRTAPKPEDWPQFVAKLRPLLTKDYDWAENVAAIQAPTLIVVGDADTVLPAHAVEMFGLLGGGKADGAMGNLSNAQLAVLPGTTHFSILARIDLLLAIITPFLDAPMPMATK